MRNKLIFASLLVATAASAQRKKTDPPKLSDDFAKAAIKYVVIVQNYEESALAGPKMAAKQRIQTAKDDMNTAATGRVTSPENLTSFSLSILGTTHVVSVETYYVNPNTDQRAIAKQNDCLRAWKAQLQKRSDEEPQECQ